MITTKTVICKRRHCVMQYVIVLEAIVPNSCYPSSISYTRQIARLWQHVREMLALWYTFALIGNASACAHTASVHIAYDNWRESSNAAQRSLKSMPSTSFQLFRIQVMRTARATSHIVRFSRLDGVQVNFTLSFQTSTILEWRKRNDQSFPQAGSLSKYVNTIVTWGMGLLRA